MERKWTVGGVQGQEVDRDAVLRLLDDIESQGHLTGGTFVLAPIRERVGIDEWLTIGWHAIWRSFTPGVSVSTPPPADVEPAAAAEPDGLGPLGFDEGLDDAEFLTEDEEVALAEESEQHAAGAV